MRDLFAGLLLVSVLVMSRAQAMPNESTHVSLINLIATPERFDGKAVFLTAYVSIGVENMSLCQTSDPASSKDCIWLEIDNGPYDTDADIVQYRNKESLWKACHGSRVSIHGVFDAKDGGHEGMWSGAIKDVSTVSGTRCHIDFV